MLFVDGIHDDILTQLSTVSGMRVIARASVAAALEATLTTDGKARLTAIPTQNLEARDDWQEHADDAGQDRQDCDDDWDDHYYYYGDDWAEAMVVGVTAVIRRPLTDRL